MKPRYSWVSVNEPVDPSGVGRAVRSLYRKLWPGARRPAAGRISQLIARTSVDADLLARELSSLPAATHSYAILFVARSGSTWLADLLSRQLDLGKPREYLNISMVGRFAAEMNAGTVADYLALLRRKRITANGVFGIKVDIHQLSTLIAEFPFADAFHGHVWFYLRRRNFVAQAISQYKTAVSGIHHRRRNDPPAERLRLEREHARIPYDCDAIAANLGGIVAAEKRGERLIAEFAIQPTRLIYEEMLAARPDQVVGVVRRQVLSNVPPVEAHVPSSNIEKIGDLRSQDFEERFRRDEALLIRRLEAERPPLDAVSFC
jgi:LPS sulfotransferase NodH